MHARAVEEVAPVFGLEGGGGCTNERARSGSWRAHSSAKVTSRIERSGCLKRWPKNKRWAASGEQAFDLVRCGKWGASARPARGKTQAQRSRTAAPGRRRSRMVRALMIWLLLNVN